MVVPRDGRAPRRATSSTNYLMSDDCQVKERICPRQVYEAALACDEHGQLVHMEDLTDIVLNEEELVFKVHAPDGGRGVVR